MIKYLKKKRNRINGITLISLVVTIIVLLILAGISITIVSGDNNILKKTGEAKETMLKTQNQEELQLAIIALKSYFFQNLKGDFVDFLLECEEYLQSELKNSELQIDKESKKIIYKGNLYSIKNDGTLILENKGIILNKNNLDLQIMGEEKQDKTLEVSKININGGINWETSNEEVATVENGKITPISEGETIITAKCNDNGEYKATCKVNVESFIDDSYVQYEVEYDDIYSGKRFSKNTGWRLISQEQNGDGTYNIEFISTGIPCKLCYGWYEIGQAEWKATVEQKNEYVNRFYNSTSNRNATYAGAGLYFNFEKITFRKQISESDRNIGGYENIIIKNKNKIMEELDGEIKGAVFAIKRGATVRNVGLSDIRGHDKIEGEEGGVKSYNSGEEYSDKKIGLFKLNDYYLDNNKVKRFFLSNPNGITNSYHILYFSSSGNTASSNGSRTTGLRPVVTMKNVNMTKEGCIWIIND